MSAIKPQLYVGIDPDVEASGLAVWDSKAKEFIDLCAEDLDDLCASIHRLHKEFVIKVRLEAGWKVKCYNWHRGKQAKVSNDVGRNHEIGRQIERYCVKHSIPYELVEPQGYSSWSHEKFCAFTGWPKAKRTNSDKRVAGMMVFGF